MAYLCKADIISVANVFYLLNKKLKDKVIKKLLYGHFRKIRPPSHFIKRMVM